MGAVPAPRAPAPVEVRPRQGALVLVLTGLSAGAALAALAYLGLAGHFNGWTYLARPLRSDFALSYQFARIGLEFGWSHLYDLGDSHAVAKELGIVSNDPNVPSLGPAPIGWLVAPLALLPLPLAYFLWLAGEAGCLLLAWRLTARGGPVERWGQLAVVPLLIPVVLGLCLGQMIFVVVAALAAAWRLLRQERQVAAGLTLCLLALKPHVAVLVPLALLLAGRRRTLLAFAGGSAGLVAIMALTLTPATVWAYALRLASASAHGQDWLVYTDLMLAALKPKALAVCLQAAAAGCALATAWLARRSPERDTLAMAAGLIGSLLVAPYLHYQDLTFLLLAAWLCVGLRPGRWLLYLLAFILIAANGEIFLWAGLTRLGEAAWLVGLLFLALSSDRVSLATPPRPAAGAGLAPAL
jgi:hypothetical protein